VSRGEVKVYEFQLNISNYDCCKVVSKNRNYGGGGSTHVSVVGSSTWLLRWNSICVCNNYVVSRVTYKALFVSKPKLLKTFSAVFFIIFDKIFFIFTYITGKLMLNSIS